MDCLYTIPVKPDRKPWTLHVLVWCELEHDHEGMHQADHPGGKHWNALGWESPRDVTRNQWGPRRDR